MQKGRPKGGKNKYWSVEEKYKIIKPILDYELSSREVTRRTGINNGMLSTWVQKYKEHGMEGLKNKTKPGNPLAKIYSKKNFKNREEELEYENMKLRIENERLKKIPCERRECKIKCVSKKIIYFILHSPIYVNNFDI